MDLSCLLDFYIEKEKKGIVEYVYMFEIVEMIGYIDILFIK